MDFRDFVAHWAAKRNIIDKGKEKRDVDFVVVGSRARARGEGMNINMYLIYLSQVCACTIWKSAHYTPRWLPSQSGGHS